MKIAITSQNGAGLESPIVGHFGHAPFFTIVEINDGAIENVESLENPFINSHTPGKVPSFINELQANGLITGSLGARAQGFFDEFGIKVYACTSGTVGDAVKMLIEGNLTAGSAGCGGGNHG